MRVLPLCGGVSVGSVLGAAVGIGALAGCLRGRCARTWLLTLAVERKGYGALAAFPVPVMSLWPHVPRGRWWCDPQWAAGGSRGPQAASLRGIVQSAGKLS